MLLTYAPTIKSHFPHLRSSCFAITAVDAKADPQVELAALMRIADERLCGTLEGEFPEIQAWRRAFSAMGLKPTQYRCASEALLRRYRKEQSLPRLHPLIELCNAASLAFAIPIAVFDQDRITGQLRVCKAKGNEIFETLAGEIEHPETGEVIFADDSDRAHARRWTHRQSGWSAIRATTHRAVVVAEALHDDADHDLDALTTVLTAAILRTWRGATMSESPPQSAPSSTCSDPASRSGPASAVRGNG